MRRFRWIAWLLVASPVLGQEPQQRVDGGEKPRLDAYGDPLPVGALRRFGTVRFRQEFVEDMSFMPDGKSMVVASSDRIVQWDVATGKPLRSYPKSPRGGRQPIGFSQDRRFLAVRPDDSHVVVIDLANGKEHFRTNVGVAFPGGVISPDQSVVAVCSTNGIVLWELKTGKERKTLTQSGYYDLRFSPDGKRLAGVCNSLEGPVVVLFDATSGKELGRVLPVKPPNVEEDTSGGFDFTPDNKSLIVSRYHSGISIYDLMAEPIARRFNTKGLFLAVTSDSRILAAVESERTIVLTNLETGKEIRRWQIDDAVLLWSRGAFSPDGKTLALPFECGIQLWDPATGKRIDPYRGPIDIPFRLAVSDDGKTIAVNYGQSLLLLDMATLKEKGRFDTKTCPIENLSFSPDSRRLAFVDRPSQERRAIPERLRLLDVATSKECTPDKGIDGFFARWIDRDHLVVVGVTEDRAGHWVTVNAADGRERDRSPIPGNLVTAPLAASSYVSRRMIVGDEVREHAQLVLADWPSGKRIRSISYSAADEIGGNGIAVLSISPDERLLVTMKDMDTLEFSETATGKPRYRLKSAYSAEFSSDGRRVLVEGDGGRTILDSLTFEPLLELGPWNRCAFSANGKFMVTTEHSSLVIWDTASLPGRKTSSEKLSPARLDELWAELRSGDARVGHRAMVALARRPEDAVPYLRSRLPDALPDEKTFDRLVRDLDDVDFKSREAAQAAIAKLGPLAGSLIRRALKDPPSLETKRRLSTLLEKSELSNDDRVRWLRSCELLERIGTPPARAALELLRHFSDPETAADAERSLERLAALTR